MASKVIKFNAGKVTYDSDSKHCTPIPHKGVVTIKQSTEDEGFFDFTWTPKSNTSGNVEKDELLIIPGDVTFKKVESCKTGRVFALTFLSSGAKHLYWLQDVGDDEDLSKLTDKDKELEKQIVDLISLIEDEDEEEEEDEEIHGEKNAQTVKDESQE